MCCILLKFSWCVPVKVCWPPASREHAFGYLLPVSSVGQNPKLWDQSPYGTVGFMQSSSHSPNWFRNACVWSQRADVWVWLAQHNLFLLPENHSEPMFFWQRSLTSTLFRITNCEHNAKPIYILLEDPDNLSPNWPYKSFYVLRDSDENRLLLGALWQVLC